MTAGASYVSPAPVTTRLEVAGQVTSVTSSKITWAPNFSACSLQSVHELRSLDAAGEAGEVLHLCGVHQGTPRGDGAGR